MSILRDSDYRPGRANERIVMNEVPDTPLQDPDVHRPNSARMYDYFLGGSTNFTIDRQTAEQAAFVGGWARANRAFLGRAVRHCVNVGIDQFLDLGSGIPTVGNVHEIAHLHNPAARVAYVDNESVAVAHARRLLQGDTRVTVTQADIRDADLVLSSPTVRDHLDFQRPIAVLAVAILHFIAEDPAQILSGYRDACVPGSYLVVSHGATDIIEKEMGEQQLNTMLEVYRNTPTPVVLRSPAELAGMVAGYTLVEPGMVPLNDWRPDDGLNEINSSAYGIVGYLAQHL